MIRKNRHQITHTKKIFDPANVLVFAYVFCMYLYSLRDGNY